MFRLTVEKGEPAGAVFDLQPGENTLGRSRAASVRVLSSDVSGLHTRIRVTAGVARVENLSQFGTRLNGQPVTGEMTLAAGQTIEIGKVTLLRVSQAEETGARVQGSGGGGSPGRVSPDAEAPTGEVANPATGAGENSAAAATRPLLSLGVTRAAAAGAGEGSDLTGGAPSHHEPAHGAAADEEGMTRAMQTRAATPEEIGLLKLNEQKRVRRRLHISVSVALAGLVVFAVFRPRTPPPETEIEWPQDASGEFLDALEPAPGGGLKDGGYDLLYPDNKTFKKTSVAGGIALEGRVGRKLDVPMRVLLQEENETRLATLTRAEMVEDWTRQMSASGGSWSFDKPSPDIAFFGKKNGVPLTRVSYLRDGGGSWFGIASVARHGCRRIVVRAEVPAAERVRAEAMLVTRLLRISEEFEFTHWEYNPEAATLSEEATLAQVRKDLERMAPATWVALENLLTGLLTKAVQAEHKETEAEALSCLAALRARETLWFNSQQLAFDDALSRGNVANAKKIMEFTKGVFSNVEDQRYFTVRKWKAEY